MDKVYEELDEAKAEIEKLKAEYRIKLELSERLKRAHNEQLTRIQESGVKINKQAQELREKEDEISVTKQLYEDLKCNFMEKEGIVKNLSLANDKLRFECDEKFRKWEEEKRELVLALEEANEKNVDQERRIRAFEDEIEGLKGIVSVSQKKCLDAEKKARGSKELKLRDDKLVEFEEEKKKVEDQLKWKKEQFTHLEEAHQKLKDQFRGREKEWESEKFTLVHEISTLQIKLDSQTRISEDIQSRLQMCNHALAHEESRRKLLEVQISESRQCLHNVFAECEEAKSRIECLTGERDKEIATLRDRLGTKERTYKEMEYRVGKLEEENQDLLFSLKELREAQIKEAGSSSSLSKMRNKLKNLRSKDTEWSSQLESKDRVIKELKMELESCHSSRIELELYNEELNLVLFVLKSEIQEAPLKLANEREEKVLLLMKQLERKNADLEKAQTEIEEEREKVVLLRREVESLKDMENQQSQLQNDLERDKEMIKEETLRRKMELKEVRDALGRANDDLGEKFCERNELEFELQIWKSIAERLNTELEREKEMIKEETLWRKMELNEASEALERANDELGEKFCERNELEFELQIWKSVAERLKAELEENQQMRREVENSLLEEIEVEVTLKEERERLVLALEEKDRLVDELEGKFNKTEGKKNLSEDLQREIDEKNNLHRLLEERNSRIDDLEKLVRSLEEKIKVSATAFSSQLEEAQVEINFLRESCEKIRTAEVLKEMEIQEKALMVLELEDDLVKLQEKMELEGKYLSRSEEKREEIEVELETKQMEIKQLTCQLETELRASENEKRKLRADREILLDFLGVLSEKISELSGEEMQLMGKWRSIVQNLDDDNTMEIELEEGGDELFDPTKENMNMSHLSLTAKKVGTGLDERSPLRSLNS